MKNDPIAENEPLKFVFFESQPGQLNFLNLGQVVSIDYGVTDDRMVLHTSDGNSHTITGEVVANIMSVVAQFSFSTEGDPLWSVVDKLARPRGKLAVIRPSDKE